MKVLVTGGTGVIGEGVIESLLKRGEDVRLISRHAEHDVRAWPDHVEAFDGDVSEAQTLSGRADGCDAVVHIAGIVSEDPPEITFERVNVGGTANIVREAERAGAKRFIYVSSLGAERGASPYHRSKLAAENVVRDSSLNWTILRPGNVYGPGDEVLSLILKMVRSLPVVPTVDSGDQPFQPLWFRDMGEAVAEVLESSDLAGRTLEISGNEVTSMADVIDRLSRIVNRNPANIPVADTVARVGASLASLLGFQSPVDENKLTMLLEENVIQGENALPAVLGITPISLDEGLKILCESLPERLPDEGVGSLHEKRVWAEIIGSTAGAKELLETFRNSFSEFMPLEMHVEQDGPRKLNEGEIISMKLPIRGNIQVRVERITDSSVALATLQGHPIAGFVFFEFTDQTPAVRFQVRVISRSSNFFDFFAMKTIGRFMQNRTWETVVERVVEASGGEAPEGVKLEEVVIEDDEAAKTEKDLENIVLDRKRTTREAALQSTH